MTVKSSSFAVGRWLLLLSWLVAVALTGCKKPKPAANGSGSAAAGSTSGAAGGSGSGSAKLAPKLPPGFKDKLAASATPEPKVEGPVGIAPGPPVEPFKAPAPPKPSDQAKALLEVAQRAHYDASDLGLQALAFKVRITEAKPKHIVIVKAHGAWKKGDKAPVVAVDAVKRDGKLLEKKSNIQKTIFTSSRFRARRLLMGLGESYLRARLRGLAGKDGKVSAPGPNKKAKKAHAAKAAQKAAVRVLYSGGEFGENTVMLANDYRVTAISNRSPVGITRTMYYVHKVVDGRHLVTGARLAVVLAPDAKVPKKVKLLMQASNGMSLSFEYKKVGRFELPVRIVKDMPGMRSKTVIELSYTGIK